MGEVRKCVFNHNLTCRRQKKPCPLQVTGFIEAFAYYLFDGRTPKSVSWDTILGGARADSDYFLADKADFNLNFRSEADREKTIDFICNGKRFSGGRILMIARTCEALIRTFTNWNEARLGCARDRAGRQSGEV